MYQDNGKKNHIRQAICLIGSNYDGILEEIGRQENIEFERAVEVYSDEEENQYENFK